MMNILISYYQYDNLMVMLYDISDIQQDQYQNERSRFKISFNFLVMKFSIILDYIKF